MISTQKFLDGFKENFTPTIFFFDSEMNELEENMVGLTTPDFYGYYLEKAINSAIQGLQN